jgi:hypothetical protein
VRRHWRCMVSGGMAGSQLKLKLNSSEAPGPQCQRGPDSPVRPLHHAAPSIVLAKARSNGHMPPHAGRGLNLGSREGTPVHRDTASGTLRLERPQVASDQAGGTGPQADGSRILTALMLWASFFRTRRRDHHPLVRINAAVTHAAPPSVRTSGSQPQPDETSYDINARSVDGGCTVSDFARFHY